MCSNPPRRFTSMTPGFPATWPQTTKVPHRVSNACSACKLSGSEVRFGFLFSMSKTVSRCFSTTRSRLSFSDRDTGSTFDTAGHSILQWPLDDFSSCQTQWSLRSATNSSWNLSLAAMSCGGVVSSWKCNSSCLVKSCRPWKEKTATEVEDSEQTKISSSNCATPQTLPLTVNRPKHSGMSAATQLHSVQFSSATGFCRTTLYFYYRTIDSNWWLVWSLVSIQTHARPCVRKNTQVNKKCARNERNTRKITQAIKQKCASHANDASGPCARKRNDRIDSIFHATQVLALRAFEWKPGLSRK